MVASGSALVRGAVVARLARACAVILLSQSSSGEQVGQEGVVQVETQTLPKGGLGVSRRDES
jgi:hypothetical protein